MSEEEELVCENCGSSYTESENTDECCEWYSNTHKGRYEVNYYAEFWVGWNSAMSGPPDSSFCRREYRNEGGYMWSICGCTQDTGECIRIGKHKPKGSALSEDDVEVGSTHSNKEESNQGGKGRKKRKTKKTEKKQEHDQASENTKKRKV